MSDDERQPDVELGCSSDRFAAKYRTVAALQVGDDETIRLNVYPRMNARNGMVHRQRCLSCCCVASDDDVSIEDPASSVEWSVHGFENIHTCFDFRHSVAFPHAAMRVCSAFHSVLDVSQV
jgi:hypothetical protein